jgi:hypothetical protein
MTPTQIETDNYDDLLKKFLDSDTDDLLQHIPKLPHGTTNGHFPPELEAVLEDDGQAEQYLGKLKKQIEAWKSTGLNGAVKEAFELLHVDGSLANGKTAEDDEDTNSRSVGSM